MTRIWILGFKWYGWRWWRYAYFSYGVTGLGPITFFWGRDRRHER